MTGQSGRCDCCDLPVESCGRADEARLQAEREAEILEQLAREPTARRARKVTQCGGCRERIEIGDAIKPQNQNGWVRWVGVGCCNGGRLR